MISQNKIRSTSSASKVIPATISIIKDCCTWSLKNSHLLVTTFQRHWNSRKDVMIRWSCILNRTKVNWTQMKWSITSHPKNLKKYYTIWVSPYSSKVKIGRLFRSSKDFRWARALRTPNFGTTWVWVHSTSICRIWSRFLVSPMFMRERLDMELLISSNLQRVMLKEWW